MAVATTAKRWTLDELHGLPDDGNKYELVDGELFVTPAPSNTHETIIARLLAWLVPYVSRHALGNVHTARAVVRRAGSEVEPDLYVRREAPGVRNDWENAPTPLLVAEVLSPFTRRRDLDQKRRFYLETVGIQEYWVVDPDARSIRVMRSGHAELVADETLEWQPPGCSEALEMDVATLFAAL